MTHEEHRSIHIIKTSSISLRAIEQSDKNSVCRWMTSSYILHNSFVIPSAKSVPNDFGTFAYAERYFTMLLSDPYRRVYAIAYDGVHIGNVGLKEISFKSMTAECFIEIGDLKFRGQGVGTKAMRLLLEIAFLKLSLDTISLDVLEFNFPALKIYHRLGFSFERENGWHYDQFGLYWRVVKMKLNKIDWLRHLNKTNRIGR